MNKQPIKIALLRCERISEDCAAPDCFDAFNNKWGDYERYKDKEVVMVGAFTCGGCPGRRVARLIDVLVKEKGLQIIHFASCISGFDGKYNHKRCIHMKNMIQYANDYYLEIVGLGTENNSKEEDNS